MLSSLVMIVMSLTLFACQLTADTFRPPTQAELAAFYKEQDITPLTNIQFEDAVVFLYQTSTSFGYYALSVREPDGEMVTSQLAAPNSDEPILVMGQSSGSHPFVAIIIQDPKLLAETATIEVAVDAASPLTASTDSQASVILVSPAFATGWRTVTLYNAQGDVLYTQGG